MKYYFYLVLVVSTLRGMDAPFDLIGTPPGSPQFHSVPNSPEIRRYNREQLLALGNTMGQCTLSHSMDTAIKSINIKTAVTAKKQSKAKHKRYAKK